MPPDAPNAPADPGRNLPPVRPPSGRFIAQLFLVPGLIVFFVVLLVLAMNYMFVGGQTPEQFLNRIDSSNLDIRWRGANDLAQALKRKENLNLRTDVAFALDLCERLDKANRALVAEEKAIGDQMAQDKNADPDKVFRKLELEAQRNLVQFLAASLGDFNFAVGVPLLGEIIVNGPGPDIKHGTHRQRQAIWSLANLGDNVKKFKELKPDYQNLIIAKLRAEEAVKLDVDETAKDFNEKKARLEVRRRAAKNALFYLGQFPGAKDADLVAVDSVLDAAARSQDQFMREIVALTLNFWDGPLAAETLARLTRDDGLGTLVEAPVDP